MMRNYSVPSFVSPRKNLNEIQIILETLLRYGIAEVRNVNCIAVQYYKFKIIRVAQYWGKLKIGKVRTIVQLL